MKREFLPLANRIFLASELKFAYRKFFHALTGKMLASGFDYAVTQFPPTLAKSTILSKTASHLSLKISRP